MDSLQELQQQLQSQNCCLKLAPEDKNWDTIWKRVQVQLENDHFSVHPRQRQGLEYILGQRWFYRVWVLQEVANARDALVYCGNKSISASIFAASPRLIGIQTHTHCQAVLDLMPGPSRMLLEKTRHRDLYFLLTEFSSAEATDEYDKIYALYGMCTKAEGSVLLIADYTKNVDDVIRDTISYICNISFKSKTRYSTITQFLAELKSLHNTVLLQLLELKDVGSAISLLKQQGGNIIVTIKLLKMAANDKLRGKELAELLL